MQQAERQLAAVVAADIAGYSRLMGRDEEGTLARLKACRRDLIDPGIARHRGRIVKTTGDGLLLEFFSPVEAVRWAVEMQQGMIERDRDVSDDKRIRFRVGINLGDVIVDAKDLYGDAVNIAARLESLADSGGVCISQAMQEHGSRPAGPALRGWRRAEGQEHRPPDPRLRALRRCRYRIAEGGGADGDGTSAGDAALPAPKYCRRRRGRRIDYRRRNVVAIALADDAPGNRAGVRKAGRSCGANGSTAAVDRGPALRQSEQ